MKLNRKLTKVLKKVGGICLVLFGAACVFMGTVYFGLWGALPSKKELKELSQYRASEIYDVNNELIGKFYIQNRQPIPLDSIPEHVINAVIATEDARFYNHSGIDTRSMFRVVIKSILLQDKSAGGGSTLTQQLAKNLYKRKDFSIFTLPVAKCKEIFIAKRLETVYEKDQILELYLNSAPFSGNTHGIESAARKFFNKSTQNLSPAEAATLIGTLKATTYYNPYKHPGRSAERRNIVLGQMQKYEYITQEEFQKFKEDSLVTDFARYDEQSGLAPYFREKLRQRMLTWCKENTNLLKQPNLYTSGLKIYTTIDKKMQEFAEAATREHLQKLQQQFEGEYGNKKPWGQKTTLFKERLKTTQAYIKLKEKGLPEDQILDSLSIKRKMNISSFGKQKKVRYSTLDSLEFYLKSLATGTLVVNNTGAIKAWVGGVDFENYKYDHVQSKRQVGSTFKPIVYTAALENGISPCDYISAREVSYENLNNWTPSNSGKKDESYINYSVKEALTQSINTVSVKIIEQTGIPNVVQLSKKLNITTKLPEVPSLALGTAELSILEMAGAYTAFINGSRASAPHFLRKIENAQGKVLETFKEEEPNKEAFSETTRQQLLAMMQNVVNNGTAKRLRSVYGLKNELAGKTGTTQSNKDAWFVGITPNLVMVTWVGHDDHRIGFKSTRLGQGANAALPVFAKFIQKINAEKDFTTYTTAKFPNISDEVKSTLDCPPTKRDGFLKRLFTNPDKKKSKKFKGRKN
ncbi:penicillin-binding protein 1A [Marinirhabdus gelatinilytica]|uniref:Penicillin-binding protein 1A n=1 Tax=Marinirhabdus gelatinilytica TaxID=1703343 RepID=A0A370Q7G8_9FLAO|nr:transglycosylase domain-containing protein [Marinirhabdus gelatinilytica]RDK84297.1 penicillin-binding protein 1A [Marinirhabdus gelatinilytica]